MRNTGLSSKDYLAKDWEVLPIEDWKDNESL